MQLRSGCDGKNKTGRRDLKSQKPARKESEKRTAWKKSKKAGWSSLDRVTSGIDQSENRSGWGASWFWSMPVLVAQVKKKSLQYKNVSGWKDLRHGLPRVRALLANLWYELWSWKKKKKKNRNCQKWRENIQKTLSTLTPLRDSNSSLGWKGCTLILFCLKVWK